jgi:cytochrome c553
MTHYGRTLADRLQHRRPDHRKNPYLILRLAFLAILAGPLAVQAEDAPNTLCTGCHNEDGNSAVPEFPKLAGLDPVYITKQTFQKGASANHNIWRVIPMRKSGNWRPITPETHSWDCD